VRGLCLLAVVVWGMSRSEVIVKEQDVLHALLSGTR
jgi:hypothetical protein